MFDKMMPRAVTVFASCLFPSELLGVYFLIWQQPPPPPPPLLAASSYLPPFRVSSPVLYAKNCRHVGTSCPLSLREVMEKLIAARAPAPERKL